MCEEKRPSEDQEAEENKTKSKGNCNTCGKKGHKEANCWIKEKNVRKKPKN